MHTLLINLDRSQDRLAEFHRVNPHLKNVTRLPAIEGKMVSSAERQKYFAEPIFYTDGAVGNALSHLKAWNEAAKSDTPVTVLEDDAIVHHDFEALSTSLIAELPPGWDIVLWGWNFDAVMSFDLYPETPCLTQFSQTDLRRNWDAIRKQAVKPSLHRLHYAFGTVGYTISSSGAKKLIERALPIKPFLYRIPALNLEMQNNAMDCVMASLYGNLHAYTCFPPLVFTKNERANSTVQQARDGDDNKDHDFGLIPSDFSASRKFKRKHARLLFKQGDIIGGTALYIQYLSSRKEKRKRK